MTIGQGCRGIVIVLAAFFLPACHESGSGGGGGTGGYPPFLRPRQFDLAVEALAMVIGGSGDVYVGGSFNRFGSISSPRLARLNADATLDTTLAVGTGFSSIVTTIAPVADGSGDIYVGGYFSIYNGANIAALVRLNSDGSIDTDFVTGTGFDGGVESIALAADGSGDVYVGGGFTSYNGTASNRLVRLNSDGSVDTAFAVGSGFDSSVEWIALAADGSGDVYVGGGFTSYNGTPSNSLIRLNSDGSVDAAFGVGTGFDGIVFKLVPAADGSGDVYVGGGFTSYNGTASNRLVRLNSDGSVDAAFGVGTGFDGAIFEVVPAADGSGDIYVGGGFTSYNGTASNRLVRLNSDGSIDTAFAVGGRFNKEVLAVAPAADGSGDVYVGGRFSAYMVRLNSDGSEDTDFPVGSGFNLTVRTLAPVGDGSGNVYAAGEFTSYNGETSNRIVRLNSNGRTDTAFAVGSGFNDWVFTLAPAVDGSGDVYVGGGFTSYNGMGSNAIIRLNSDGSVDTAFSVGSGITTYVAVGFVFALAPVADGSGDVYVGGEFAFYNGMPIPHFIRLNSDGSVDTAFSVGSGIGGAVRALALAPDGSGDVYVGGDFTSYNGTPISRLVRLNSDGSVDTAFSVGSGFNDNVFAIALAPDGSGDIYVGGRFTSYNGTASNGLIRLNSDGSVDTAFAVGSGFNNWVLTLALAADGSGDIYVGGGFTSYNGTPISRLVRLNSDGSVDTAFAVGSGFNDWVFTLAPAVDGSGDVFVGGQFTLYNGEAADFIARLRSDGTWR